MARNVQINERQQENASSGIDFTPREWARIQERERLEKRRQRNLTIIMVLLLLLVAMLSYLTYYFVFRSHDIEVKLAYQMNHPVFGMSAKMELSDTADGFAHDLCVSAGDVNRDAVSIMATEGALFDLNARKIDYAKNIYTPRSPASLTKIMTALVALKYANPDDMVICSEIIENIDEDSSVCGLQVGDQLSLKQLLYGLLVASGNDAAMIIAEHVAGSVDRFVELMNEEAWNLGATGTHFCNPHGLSDPQHNTSAYDLYLIFRECMKYDLFMDMISRTNYYAEYNHADGSIGAITWDATNHYFTGEAYPPDNVIIYGGKTGTTDEAGACLLLLSKDLYGNPYLSVIMNAETKEELYREMNDILALIKN